MRRYSILNNLNKCYFCGKPKQHIHEVFFGANRQRSIQNGFCVGLCFKCHRDLHDGKYLSDDETMNLHLKKLYQTEFERSHTREEFLTIIGESYL